MTPLRIFIGVDSRQPLAYSVCRGSLERYARHRIQVEPIRLDWTQITRRGLTDFTFARYAVPLLCGYEGVAIFMDADIVVTADIGGMLEAADPLCEVSVVTNQNKALLFERPSVMLFQNRLCKELTAEYINDPHTRPQALEWADKVGELPAEWNFCVGYDKPAATLPKLLHYTQGIPCWPETKDCDYADVWVREHRHINSTVSWQELMGGSVHAEAVRKRLAASPASASCSPAASHTTSRS